MDVVKNLSDLIFIFKDLCILIELLIKIILVLFILYNKVICML